jgi:hypothetical protein
MYRLSKSINTLAKIPISSKSSIGSENFPFLKIVILYLKLINTPIRRYNANILLAIYPEIFEILNPKPIKINKSQYRIAL